MAVRRGNQSDYDDEPPGNELLSFNKKQLALAWASARRRDPMDGLYDKLKRDKTLSETVNCLDVIHALEFLHAATCDVRFQDAGAALRQIGLTKGGVRQSVMAKLRENGLRPSAFGIGALKMHAWVEKEGMSVSRAARLVAAQYGLPGKNDDSVARYGAAYAGYLSEVSRRVQNNCTAALNSDFAPIFEDGLSPKDKAALKRLYEEKVEPFIAAVIGDFKSVTKDLQEKYRDLSKNLELEKAAENI
jgi:hypothetical protein